MTATTLRTWTTPVLLVVMLIVSGLFVLDGVVRTAPDPDQENVKTVTVCWGTEGTVHFGRVTPGEVLHVIVKKGCCKGVKGSVVVPSPMGWRGGGSGEQIIFTTRVPENKSGVHIGLFRGTMLGCTTAKGDGEGDGDDGKKTTDTKKEPWEVTAIGRIGEKEDPDGCGIATNKQCVDEDTVLVSASLVGAINPLCRVKLIDTRNGEELAARRGIAFAQTDDDTSHTIKAVSECCGERDIEIKEDECGGGDGGDGCCNLAVNAAPEKAIAPGIKVKVTADFDFRNSENCPKKDPEDVCKARFIAKGVKVKGNKTKTKKLNASGKTMVTYTPVETGSLGVTVKPVGEMCNCEKKSVEIDVRSGSCEVKLKPLTYKPKVGPKLSPGKIALNAQDAYKKAHWHIEVKKPDRFVVWQASIKSPSENVLLSKSKGGPYKSTINLQEKKKRSMDFWVRAKRNADPGKYNLKTSANVITKKSESSRADAFTCIDSSENIMFLFNYTLNMEDEPSSNLTKNTDEESFGEKKKKEGFLEYAKFITKHIDDSFVPFGIGDNLKDWTGQGLLRAHTETTGQEPTVKMDSSDGKIQVATKPKNQFTGKLRTKWDIFYTADIKAYGAGQKGSTVTLTFSYSVISVSKKVQIRKPAMIAIQTGIGFKFEGDPARTDEFKTAWGDDEPVIGSIEEGKENKTIKAQTSAAETKKMKGGKIDLSLKIETFAQAKKTADISGPLSSEGTVDTDLRRVRIKNRDILIVK